MQPCKAKAIVARARALVGTRFVPHGRDPAYGLDCVGLVANACGVEAAAPGYALRCGSLAVLDRGMTACGLIAVSPTAPGDVIAVTAGPGQLHLGIWTGVSLIHADAGLRRVVERPAPLPWPVIGGWRVPAEEEDVAWRR